MLPTNRHKRFTREVPMAFKTGLVIGFGAGYVLGARAGRERYDQIVSVAKQAQGRVQGARQ